MGGVSAQCADLNSVWAAYKKRNGFQRLGALRALFIGKDAGPLHWDSSKIMYCLQQTPPLQHVGNSFRRFVVFCKRYGVSLFSATVQTKMETAKGCA